jgi:enoyl-[acyl-carrier protein] reductase I
MADTSGLMKGKRGLIMGVANNRSIAWGIAKACADAGAELALTYQGEALKKRVEPLATELGAIVAGHCDVTDLDSYRRGFRRNGSEMGQARFRRSRHRISDKDELTGRYVETTRENFNRTMDISVYS